MRWFAFILFLFWFVKLLDGRPVGRSVGRRPGSQAGVLIGCRQSGRQVGVFVSRWSGSLLDELVSRSDSLVGVLVCRLVSSLGDVLVGRLVRRSSNLVCVDQPIGQLDEWDDWLVGRSVGRSGGRSVGRLVGRSVGPSVSSKFQRNINFIEWKYPKIVEFWQECNTIIIQNCAPVWF